MEKIIEFFLKKQNELSKREDRDESYHIEFMKLKEVSQNLKEDATYSRSIGVKPNNLQKNRYKDILPFDYCRVKLNREEKDDFINASFIKSPTRQMYIATQGPLQSTLEDFWDMIWQQDITTIIMACLENEGCPPKNKCQRYWGSADDDIVVGSYVIKLLEEDFVQGSDVIYYKRLQVLKNDEERIINHFHHTLWPDKLIPKCVDSILTLISSFRSLHPSHLLQPILVHCSAGCGRTGTIIAIDYIRTMLLNKSLPEDFSILEVVSDMRRQRVAMVQTLEQYQYIYMAVKKMFEDFLSQQSPEHIYDNVARRDSSETTYENLCEMQNGTKCRSPIKSPDNDYVNSSPLYSTVNFNRKALTKTSSCDMNIKGETDETLNDSQILRKRSFKEKVFDSFHKNKDTSGEKSSLESSSETKTHENRPKYFLGYDISFPNRPGRPKGPRPLESSDR